MGEERTPSMDGIKSSPFLSLPAELRIQIYKVLFSSTRLTFGIRETIDQGRVVMKPARNSLAILQTCRQVAAEAGPLWLGRVVFNFGYIEDMFDKLTGLPASIILQIRHMWLCCPSLTTPEWGTSFDNDLLFRVASILPDLHLDRLTVLDASYAENSYNLVDDFVRDGSRWRELRFITPDSDILSFPRLLRGQDPPFRRSPQPVTWNKMLLQRDGVESGSSVTVYRSLQCTGRSGDVLDPSKREVFEQRVPPATELPIYGLERDTVLMREEEREKELMITIKRGPGVNISKQSKSREGRQNSSENMTWKDIKITQFFGSVYMPNSEEDNFLKNLPVEFDMYNDVDEFDWRHFT